MYMFPEKTEFFKHEKHTQNPAVPSNPALLYTNSEEKAGLVLFNKYPLQHIILGTGFCV